MPLAGCHTALALCVRTCGAVAACGAPVCDRAGLCMQAGSAGKGARQCPHPSRHRRSSAATRAGTQRDATAAAAGAPNGRSSGETSTTPEAPTLTESNTESNTSARGCHHSTPAARHARAKERPLAPEAPRHGLQYDVRLRRNSVLHLRGVAPRPPGSPNGTRGAR